MLSFWYVHPVTHKQVGAGSSTNDSTDFKRKMQFHWLSHPLQHRIATATQSPVPSLSRLIIKLTLRVTLTHWGWDKMTEFVPVFLRFYPGWPSHYLDQEWSWPWAYVSVSVGLNGLSPTVILYNNFSENTPRQHKFTKQIIYNILVSPAESLRLISELSPLAAQSGWFSTRGNFSFHRLPEK